MKNNSKKVWQSTQAANFLQEEYQRRVQQPTVDELSLQHLAALTHISSEISERDFKHLLKEVGYSNYRISKICKQFKSEVEVLEASKRNCSLKKSKTNSFLELKIVSDFSKTFRITCFATLLYFFPTIFCIIILGLVLREWMEEENLDM